MAAHKIRYTGPGKNIVEAQLIGRVGKLTRADIRTYGNRHYDLAYVCSPFADDPVGNMARAKVYARYVIDHEGAQPLVSHLLYPAILGQEETPDIRQMALDYGMGLLGLCSRVYVFRPGGKTSPGMAAEIREAMTRFHIPVTYVNDDKVYAAAEEAAAATTANTQTG